MCEEFFKVSKKDLNTMLQWFNAVQDLNEPYLNKNDYEIAREIHKAIGIRVPGSIEKYLNQFIHKI